MTTTLIDFAAMRPEYSRLERYYDLAQLHLALDEPDKALKWLDLYLRWNAHDATARATRDRIVMQAQAIQG